MAVPQTSKPLFKVPEKGPPLKMAEMPSVPITGVGHGYVEDPPIRLDPNDWQPLATAPTDPASRFMVRVCVNGKPVGGTETLVRYRATRKRINKKWIPALTIVDDRLGTKLGFRPSEWKPEATADVGGN